MPLDIEQLLIESLYRPLSEEEQVELDTALENSTALRREAAEVQVLKFMLRDLQAPTNDTFRAQLLKKLTEKEKGSADWVGRVVRFFPKVAAASVAVLLISVLSIYLTEGSLGIHSLIGVDGLPPAEAEYVLDVFGL